MADSTTPEPQAPIAQSNKPVSEALLNEKVLQSSSELLLSPYEFLSGDLILLSHLHLQWLPDLKNHPNDLP
jgi:hypothetical protein